MQEHVLYYFSGTGNSLRAALGIQKALGNCDVVSMGTVQNPKPRSLTKVTSIGFVFPSYFGGVPHRVKEFIAALDMSENTSSYVYAVVTYGAVVGSALGQLSGILQKKGVALSYGATLKAFANYVVLYDMSDKVAEKIAETKAALTPLIQDICNQTVTPVKKASVLTLAYNRMSSKEIAQRDKHFVVKDTCTQCGICELVCPVSNVRIEEGNPQWLGKCEQCMACIQWCPERAINYGDKTDNRGRYTNPEITSKMFIAYLNGLGEEHQES